MNYRHAFHAGNFADLVKHAGLTAVLAALEREPGPLLAVDTHAGAGVYDLQGPEASASGESAIDRLLADPAAPLVFETLKTAVARLNPKGGARFYPGSPSLIAGQLRAKDRLVACELRPDDAERLRAVMKGASAEVLRADGFETAVVRAAAGQRLFVLIDPPYERPDDYARTAAALRAIRDRSRSAVLMAWLPLKDLETFDGFLRRLEQAGLSALVVETRLRPLDDPMRLNGCALVVVNPVEGLDGALEQASDWVAKACGEPDADSRVWVL